MKSKKILHVIGGLNRGGAETFLVNALQNIHDKTLKFYFLCYGDDKFDYEDIVSKHGGIILKTPDVKDVGIFNHIKNIRNIIKENNIDILHTHTYFNSVFSLIAGTVEHRKLRIVHAHTTRSEYNPNLFKRIYFAISKVLINLLSTKLIACGNDAGKSLFFNRDFTIINNGINAKDFTFNTQARTEVRESLNVVEDTLVIGHVGRIDTQKNQRFAIDVFQHFLHTNPNSLLVLVGDGHLKPELEEYIKIHELEEKVVFTGSRPDTYRLYNAMDIFIFPSLREGIPLTLIEAQANGLKCLISDTIDPSVDITGNLTFLSLRDSHQTWAKTIESLLSKSGARTPNAVLDSDYDATNSAKELERLYANTK